MENASWRWVFFINLPIAVIVILLSLWRVPESRDEAASKRLDWQGAALATFGLGAITYALIECFGRDVRTRSSHLGLGPGGRGRAALLPFRRITFASSDGLFASLPVQRLFRGQPAHVPALRAAEWYLIFLSP